MTELTFFNPPDVPEMGASGVLLVDKPQTWTSFDVVNKLKGILKQKKIGHAGTLDPMATGLLIVCVGRSATKHIDQFMGMEKGYTATLRLGEITPSYDADSEVTQISEWKHLSEAEIEAACMQFVGEIEQRPPIFSAIKIAGERLYKKARRGEEIDIPTRKVQILSLELLSINGQDVQIAVKCSKGTYIRSLAHDIGQVLGCGAHLIALRRTQIGNYHVDNAFNLSDLAKPKSS
jgi:tRNA pseudouridine55 synthase